MSPVAGKTVGLWPLFKTPFKTFHILLQSPCD